jgi:phospholipase C
MTTRLPFAHFAAWTLSLVLAGCAAPPLTSPRAGLEKIQHIVVIYAENRSFDNLYGLFPAAGIADATAEQYTQ